MSVSLDKVYNEDQVCIRACDVRLAYDGMGWAEVGKSFQFTIHGIKFLCGGVMPRSDMKPAPDDAAVTCLGCLAAS